jgi:hypothetical protein
MKSGHRLVARTARGPQVHPAWCGRTHVCTAETMPAGEHRSDPLTFHSNGGLLVLTRVQTRAGVNRLEVRAVLTLPADPMAAHCAAQATVLRLHEALGLATGGGRR